MVRKHDRPCRKVRHTKVGSIIALRKLKDAGLARYFCERCRAWHVGHQRERNLDRINQLLDQVLGR